MLGEQKDAAFFHLEAQGKLGTHAAVGQREGVT